MKVFRNIIVAVLLIIAVGAAVYILLHTQKNNGDNSGETEYGGVVISEFMASNSGCLPDENGEYNDWIEIHNPTGQAVDLFGYGLSDENSPNPKWTFPAITLEPDEYLVVFASGTGTSGSGEVPHASFKLSAGGGGIYLIDTAGKIIDKVEYKKQAKDVSMGRVPGTQDEWQPFSATAGVGPTPGFPNDAAGRERFEQSRVAADTDIRLIITEVMTSNRATITDNTGALSDYIEIFNPGSKAVDLKGFGLSDDPAKTLKWKFPEAAIEPGQYLVVFASGEGEKASDAAAGVFHTNFRLSSYKETILLSNPQGLILDRVDVAEVPADNAYARVLTDGGYGDAWEVSKQPTPGFSNDEAGYTQFVQNR